MTKKLAENPFLINVASAIWAARDTIEAVFEDGDDKPTTTRIVLSNGLSIAMTDSINGFRENLKTTIEHGKDVVVKSGHTIVNRAWEAVQAHVMLKRLGRTVEIDAPVFFYPVQQTMLDRVMKRKKRIDTQSRVRSGLMRRIKEVMAEMDTHPSNGWLDIGNEVEVLSEHHPIRFDQPYMAWAYTPSHGKVEMYWLDMAEAFDALRSRAIARLGRVNTTVSTPVTISDSSKEAEILRLGHDALRLDPSLADRAGTPLKPLVERHLPDLIRKHGEALTEAKTDADRNDSDRQFDEGLNIVALAIEDGIRSQPSKKRDELLTHLQFLRSRHVHLTEEIENPRMPL